MEVDIQLESGSHMLAGHTSFNFLIVNGVKLFFFFTVMISKNSKEQNGIFLNEQKCCECGLCLGKINIVMKHV